MKTELKNYLRRLKAYGIEKNIPNVTDEVGMFLNMMIRIQKPKTILEIGCANGYSTIWMAESAAEIGSKVITVDHSAPTFAEAQKNLHEAGLSEVVEFNFGDARKVIPAWNVSRKFDFVFIDGQKASYVDFWNILQDLLNPGAVLVWDDMIAFPEKTKSFSLAIKNIDGYDRLLIPIDENDGILLMIKNNL